VVTGAPTGGGGVVAPNAELALRYSPVASPGAPSAGDGGIVFDSSAGWREAVNGKGKGGGGGGGGGGTRATPSESAVAHNAFRFFDGDMHYSEAGLNTLVRGLQRSSTLDRERFFSATVGVRRRMDRKWQETPLAKCFTLSDEFAVLKQRAACCFVRESLRSRKMKKWEAFMAFDSDDNGLLGASEIYGALRFLGMPGLTPEDVVDFLESGDVNRDGLLDYKEFLDLVEDPDSKDDDDDDDDDEEEEDGVGEKGANAGQGGAAAAAGAEGAEPSKRVVSKVEPYGAEEVREVIVQRKREELAAAREDRARREAYAADLDRKIFEEELKASASRVGGANPIKLISTAATEAAAVAAAVAVQGEEGKAAATSAAAAAAKLKNKKDGVGSLVAMATSQGEANATTTEYRFTRNSAPLRTVVTGKGAAFKVVLEEVLRRRVLKKPMCCQRGHVLQSQGYLDRYSQCRICKKRGVKYYCPQMYSWSSIGTPCQDYRVCDKCHKNEGEDRLRQAADPRRNETYMVAEPGSSLSLMVPTDAVTSDPFQGLLKTVPDSIAASSAAGAGAGGGALALLEDVNPRLAQLSATAAVSGVRLGLSFTVSMEVMLPLLPPVGQRLALLRFSPPPPAQGRAAKRQQASVYVTSTGEVGGTLMVADEKRRQKAHNKALVSVAGLRCALRLGSTLKKSNAEKAENAAKKKVVKDAAAANKAEEDAAEAAKQTDVDAAEAAKKAEEDAEKAKEDAKKAEETAAAEAKMTDEEKKAAKKEAKDAAKVEAEEKKKAEKEAAEEKKRADKEAAAKAKPKVGDKVEALFKGKQGKWFAATIVKVVKGDDDDDDEEDDDDDEEDAEVSFDLVYDDSDKASASPQRVPSAQVRTLEASKAAAEAEAAAAEAAAVANAAAVLDAEEKEEEDDESGGSSRVVLRVVLAHADPAFKKFMGTFDQASTGNKGKVNGARLLTKKVAPGKKLYMYRVSGTGTGDGGSGGGSSEQKQQQQQQQQAFWMVAESEADLATGAGVFRCADSGGLPASPISRFVASSSGWQEEEGGSVASASFVADESGPPPAAELSLDSPGGPQVALAEAWRRLSGWRNTHRGCLQPKRWHSLTLVVDSTSSTAATLPATHVFVDGAKTPASLVPRPAAFAANSLTNPLLQSDEAAGAAEEEALHILGLGRRMILFGGGKQAEARGGCVRRVRVTDGMLSATDVAQVHRTAFPGLNPLFAGSATSIQAQVRRRQAKARAVAVRAGL
jgi:hypothetical protein